MAYIKPELNKENIKILKNSLGIENDFALPRIEKVILNMGVGKIAASNLQMRQKILEETAKILSIISGQKPSPARVRKSIAGFKTREGDIVGYITTLRGKRMVDFLSRLVNIALPRTRDFRGIPLKSVDGHGNLTIGIREHIVFPEAAQEDIRHLYGFEITIVLTTRNRDKALALYRALGFPFEKK
jgi:large subunit ribosomal protein L5